MTTQLQLHRLVEQWWRRFSRSRPRSRLLSFKRKSKTNTLKIASQNVLRPIIRSSEHENGSVVIITKNAVHFYTTHNNENKHSSIINK